MSPDGAPVEKASLTRAKPMPVADRRWRIKILAALALIFAALVTLGVVEYVTIIGNRGVGTGNRAVDCAIAHHVVPELNLPECVTPPGRH